MFRILDRYTFREILPPFGLALLVFTFMLMMSPIDRVAPDLLSKGVPAATIARMLLLLVPQALAVTIPMAFLLGLLVAFGRLSGDSEWVALQACGVTLVRILRPVLLMAFVAWGATQWVLLEAVPWCNQAFREIEYRVVAARIESEIRPRVFFADFPGLVVYVRNLPQGVVGWADVFLADTSSPGPPQLFVASRGRVDLDRGQRRVTMVLQDTVSYKFGVDQAGKSSYERNLSEELKRNLDPEKVLPKAGPQKGDQEMTVAELRAAAEELRRNRLPTARPEYNIHMKFAIPVACLVFALMGLGFGVSTSRGGKLAAFALGSGVIFVYYVVMFQARAAALGGVLPGGLAAWMPNIVLGPVGVFVVARRARSSGGAWQVLAPTAAFIRRFLPSPEGAGGRPAAAPGGGAAVVVVRFPRIGLPRPGILDRYISRSYLRLQGLTFVSLLGVFYIATFIDLADKLFGGKVTPDLLLRFFYFKTPQFIFYVIPISVLIATLVTIGGLTRNSELIVMKACGVSLYRAAAPLFAFAALASLVLFGLQEHVLAYSNRYANDLDRTIRSGSPQRINLANRRWVVGRNGEIYHFLYFDVKSGEFRDLWKYELDQRTWRLSRVTFANSVKFDKATYRPDAPSGRWRAVRGWSRDLSPEGEPRAFDEFPSRDLVMEPPDYFGSEQPEAAGMTYGELSAYIDEMRGSGLNILQLLVDLHRKLSFPFVTVVMTLLAVPFAVTTGRRGALYGIGIGIVLAIVYWTANNLFGLVGGAGMIAPVLAAWAPNLLFGAGAAFLLLTVRT
jgi:LPS export ABC transporter permease LptG/LPS export ABC transporter permease LptF